MKISDLVNVKNSNKPAGIIIKIDKEYYGARQAFKRYNWKRGECINSKSADGYGPTALGITDRVLVYWPEFGFEYFDSSEIEIVSEIRRSNNEK